MLTKWTYNTIASGEHSVFPSATVLHTSDLWSPHSADTEFHEAHAMVYAQPKISATMDDNPIVLDIEPMPLISQGGEKHDFQQPEHVWQAIEWVKSQVGGRCPVGGYNGVSSSYAQLTAIDGTEYRHHIEWSSQSDPWRSAILNADFWCVSLYHDGRFSFMQWVERAAQLALAWNRQFPTRLTAYLWHRKIGDETWLPEPVYVRMGETCRALGLPMFLFGSEHNPGLYDVAQRYARALEGAIV